MHPRYLIPFTHLIVLGSEIGGDHPFEKVITNGKLVSIGIFHRVNIEPWLFIWYRY